jgi:type II secretory pathway component PulF
VSTQARSTAGAVPALEALADLRAAGHDVEAAVACVAKVGGSAGRFAEQIQARLAAGASLGLALRQLGAISTEELEDLGGPAGLDAAPGLRALAARRARRAARRRTLLGALGFPLAMAVLTAGSLRATVMLVVSMVAPGAAGSDGLLSGFLGDLLPFALLAAGVWAVTGRGLRLSRRHGLSALPILGGLDERASTADVADWLAMAAQAHLAPAVAFESAVAQARGPTAHGLSGTARRLAEGANLAECLPPAGRVGERLALALATGVGTGDLTARLRALAADEREAVERQARRLVRIVAWITLMWVCGRSMSGALSMATSGLGSGLGGGGGIELPGITGPGGDLDQLFKELE